MVKLGMLSEYDFGIMEQFALFFLFTEPEISGCVQKQSAVSQTRLPDTVAQPGQPQPVIQPDQVSFERRLYFTFQLNLSTSPQPHICVTKDSKELFSAGNRKRNVKLVVGSSLTFRSPFHFLFLSNCDLFVAAGSWMLPAYFKPAHSNPGSEQHGYTCN